MKRQFKKRYTLIGLLLLVHSYCLLAQGPTIPVPEPKQVVKRTTSKGSTGHFEVSGEDIGLNKAVSSICDNLVTQVAKFIGEKRPKSSVYPIKLELYSRGNAKPGAKFTTSVIPIQNKGYVIHLKVDIRKRIDRATLEQGIMQAVILERTMRTDPKVNEETIISVPRWLSDGLLGAIQWKENPMNRSIYILLKQRPELFGTKELFAATQKKVRELGKPKIDLYHASATAMVLSLQRQEGGKKSLATLLGEVAVFEGETEELLRRNFSTMNVGVKSLQKSWNLQLADMSVPRLVDTLSIIETETRLKELLHFTLRGKGGRAKFVPIEHYRVLLGLVDEERNQILRILRQNLAQLSLRCYPDFQPILAEYSFVVNDIANRKLADIPVRLNNLAVARKKKLEDGQRVRDVIDWYQISQAKGLNGDFSGYQKLMKLMEEEKKEQKDSVLSPYLDTIENLMLK